MTDDRHEAQARRVIIYAGFSSVVMAGFVWLVLSNPPMERLLLALGVLLVIEVFGVLWFIGPERRQRIMPFERLRQTMTGKWTCSTCGLTQPAGSYACDNCGALNPTKIWHCEICESDVTVDLSHCPECGTARPVSQ